jgi:hypothetical protein
MNTGRLVTFQQTFVRLDDTGVRHACDLHWQIANRPACAALLRFDEIAREARAVADLDGAAAPSPPHALLIACLHRLVHHHDAPTLIWIYDLHLLASAMTPAEAERTRGLAEEKRLAAVCAAALAAAHGLFGTVVPGPLRELRARGPEPLAIFLEDGLRPLDVLALDLRALPGWRARCQLLREHLFPPREYLQAIEGRLGRGPLPLLYARRVVRGASRWFRPAPREF